MLTSSRLLNDIQQCTPPVGCASDRTVLRTAQDGGVSLRQVRVFPCLLGDILVQLAALPGIALQKLPIAIGAGQLSIHTEALQRQAAQQAEAERRCHKGHACRRDAAEQPHRSQNTGQ